MPIADFKRWWEDVSQRIMYDSRLKHPDWQFFRPILPKGSSYEDQRDQLKDVINDAYADIVAPKVKREPKVRLRNENFLDGFIYQKRSDAFLRSKDVDSSLFTPAIKEIFRPYVSSKAGKTTKDIAIERGLRYARGSSDTDDMEESAQRQIEDLADTRGSDEEKAADQYIASASPITKKRAESALAVVCSNFGVSLPPDVHETAIASLLGGRSISTKVSEQAALSGTTGVQAGELFEILSAAIALMSHMERTQKRPESALRDLDKRLSLYVSKL